MDKRGAAENQLASFLEKQKGSPEVITTGNGQPIGDKDATITVGRDGPIVLKDHHFLDEMAHLDRERIPERVAHAKGGGGFGYFEVTHDITKYCAAKLFDTIGKKTPIAIRFSTVAGEKGSADTVRDNRGFAIKFYTEDGNWDLVGLNTPIFFIRDPVLFPSMLHSQKRNPVTNLRDPNMMWDFNTLRPETTHQNMILFSDRGIPDGFRYMHGFGSHTFKLVNKNKQYVFCKFHFRSVQGIRNLTPQRAMDLAGSDPDYSTRDLFNAIGRGDLPKWNMFIQVMTPQEAEQYKYNPFDLTKVWSHQDYPLIPVGCLTLDKNPNNFFADIEQLALAPAHLVPGIEASPDKMLQSRLFAYSDTQRYRLGTNNLQLPVNLPYRVNVANYQRDGSMTYTDNQDGAPNYFPNSFGGPIESSWARQMEAPYRVQGEVRGYSHGDTEDNYSQPRKLWRRVLSEGERGRLVTNLASSLKNVYPFIQERAVNNFSQVDRDFGKMLSDALQIKGHADVERRHPGVYNPAEFSLRDLDYLKMVPTELSKHEK